MRPLLGFLLLAAALAEPLSAGGFTTPIIGSRMIGRLAFAAKADDTSAIFHNPAGLAFIDDYRVDASFTGIYSHTLYRLQREDGTFTEPIESERPYGVIPYVGFCGDFGQEKLRLGLAVYSPHNTGSSLPEDAETRFQLIEGTIFTLYTTPTAAYRITDDLAVGLGLSLVRADATLKRWNDFSESVGLPVTALVDLEAHDNAGFAWNFGVLWRPADRHTLGLTYMSETDLTIAGSLTAENPDIALIADADVDVDFTLPQILRVGWNVDFTDRLDAGIDLYWMDYSVYQALTLDISDIRASIGGTPIDIPDTSISEPKNSEDIYGGAIGGTYEISDRWLASAGYLYDPSPYPDSTYSILSPDANKHGLAIGGSWIGKRFEVHASYLRLIYKDRDVDNSILEKPANGNVHGKFNNAFGLQVAYRF